MAELTREQIEQVYSNFEKVIDCSPVHEGKAEARKCLRMVTDLALSALDAQGGDASLPSAQESVAWMVESSHSGDVLMRDLYYTEEEAAHWASVAGGIVCALYRTAPPPPEAMLKALRKEIDVNVDSPAEQYRKDGWNECLAALLSAKT